MCMGCMTNADFVLTSGIVGAASLRVGVRQLLPRAPRWTRRVSDDEAAAFVASLRTPEPSHASDRAPAPTRAADAALVLGADAEVPVDPDEARVPAPHAEMRVEHDEGLAPEAHADPASLVPAGR